MAGTTPVLKLPYPTGTDRVADGDNAIQALAQRVETVLNYSQVNLVLPAGISNHQFASMAWARGGACTCHLTIIAQTGVPDGFKVATVPAGYRPPYQVWMPVRINRGGAGAPVSPTPFWVVTESGDLIQQGSTLALGDTAIVSFSFPLALPTAVLLPAPDRPEATPQEGNPDE